MNTQTQHPDDRELHTLLRESRPHPGLPPRFQENVWRRIDQAEVHGRSSNWFEALAGLLLKPRFAVASVGFVLLIGTLLGSLDGQSRARLVAQERYVASVVMPVAP
jgi:hypothetical protein